MRRSFECAARRIGLLLAGLLVAAACLDGCGADDSRVSRQSYGDDGFMGFSNAHPGLLTNPRSRTYRADSRMMERAIAGIEGVERSAIIFNGGRVFVRLRVGAGLDASECEAIRKEAERKLRHMAPRYSFTVKVVQQRQ